MIPIQIHSERANMTTSLLDLQLLSCESVGQVFVVKPAAEPRSFSDELKLHEYNFVMRKIGLNGGWGLLINLSDCEMLDSVTVGVFIQLSREGVRFGGRTVMCGASSSIRETLARLMLLEPERRVFAWRQFTTAVCAMAELQSSSAD
jgi:hypothetical protein